MNTRVTFQIKHASGKVVDSISLPSIDVLWSEKEFTEKHGKESQSSQGMFRLWRDDTDDRLIVLSMISKIPDPDVSNSCFQFVVQVQQPSARVIEPTITYYDSNTSHVVPEAHFAMASKTPDEVAGKTKRGATEASGSKSSTKKTPSGARAVHKGASTNAKKPKSAATLSVTTPAPVISARGGSGSAFAPCVSGATKAKPNKAKSKKKNSVGATGQSPKPRSRTTRRIRKQNGGAASPVGIGLAAPCTRRDGTGAAHHKDSDGMITSTMITGNTFAHGDASVPDDGCLPTMPVSSASAEQHMAEGQWCCPPPELPAGPVEDNDMSTIQHADEAVATGYETADYRHDQHGGDDGADAEADEAEMVGLVNDNSYDDGDNNGNDIYSPVWSQDSRSSSAASMTGSVMSTNDMLRGSLGPNYTVDATPGPMSLMQMQVDAQLPPAPPSPPPLLSFGRRDVAAPATSGRLPQPAARMLADNTPMQAIEAGDGDTTASTHRRSSLDMALLYDTDSNSSWMDDNDGTQQGAVEGEDSPQFVSVVHGTPMAFSLAAKFSPTRLH